MASQNERSAHLEVPGFAEQVQGATQVPRVRLSSSHPGLVPDTASGDIALSQDAKRRRVADGPIESVFADGSSSVVSVAPGESPDSVSKNKTEQTTVVAAGPAEPARSGNPPEVRIEIVTPADPRLVLTDFAAEHGINSAQFDAMTAQANLRRAYTLSTALRTLDGDASYILESEVNAGYHIFRSIHNRQVKDASLDPDSLAEAADTADKILDSYLFLDLDIQSITGNADHDRRIAAARAFAEDVDTLGRGIPIVDEQIEQPVSSQQFDPRPASERASDETINAKTGKAPEQHIPDQAAQVVARNEEPGQMAERPDPKADESAFDYQKASRDYLAARNAEHRRLLTHLPAGVELQIPTVNGNVGYVRETQYLKTQSTGAEYDLWLFGDQYEDVSTPQKFLARRRRDKSRVKAGGKDAALAAGRVVLDLGPGEAVGLHQYAQDAPYTTFWGPDTGYNKQVTLDRSKPGVQLTNDDWKTLESVPDNSVDTILSVAGVTIWGIDDAVEAQQVARTLTRVAKEGAIFRYSRRTVDQTLENFEDMLREQGWEFENVPNVGIAVKRTEAKEKATRQAEQRTSQERTASGKAEEENVVTAEAGGRGGDGRGGEATLEEPDEGSGREKPKIRVTKRVIKELGEPRIDEALYTRIMQEEYGVANPSKLVLGGRTKWLIGGGFRIPFRRKIYINAIAAEKNAREAERKGNEKRKNLLARIIAHEAQHDADFRNHPVRTTVEYGLKLGLAGTGLYLGSLVDRYAPALREHYLKGYGWFLGTLAGAGLDGHINPSERRARQRELDEELVNKFKEVVVFPQQQNDGENSLVTITDSVRERLGEPRIKEEKIKEYFKEVYDIDDPPKIVLYGKRKRSLFIGYYKKRTDTMYLNAVKGEHQKKSRWFRGKRQNTTTKEFLHLAQHAADARQHPKREKLEKAGFIALPFVISGINYYLESKLLSVAFLVDGALDVLIIPLHRMIDHSRKRSIYPWEFRARKKQKDKQLHKKYKDIITFASEEEEKEPIDLSRFKPSNVLKSIYSEAKNMATELWQHGRK